MQLSTMFPAGQAGPFGGAEPTPPPSYTSGPFQAVDPQAQAQQPALPQGGPFVQQPQPQDTNRQRLEMLLPAIVTGLAPAFGLRGAASMMAGVMRGQEKKRALGEHEEQTRIRKATEAAKFRLDALSEVAKLPPEQQAIYVDAMADIGQQLYGVDLHRELGAMQQAGATSAAAAPQNFGGVVPGTGIPVPTAGPTAKQRAAAEAIVKKNDAVAKGRRWSAMDPDTGQSRSDAEWRQLAGGGGTLEDGSPLLPEAEKDKGVEPVDVTKSSLDVQLANARRRAAHGEPGAADEVKLLEQTIKDTDAYRRDPRAPRPDGPTDPQAFQMSERLAKAWQGATASTREMNRQLGLMETGLKRFRQGDKNGGSQAVLVTFQKILDPTSVVRESEYARSAAGISLLGRIEGYADRLKAGGAGVPDAELAQMVQTARDFVSGMQTYAAGTRKRIEAQATKYKLDPATIFDDVLTGGGGDAPPPPGDAAPSNTAAESALEKLNRRRALRGPK